MGHNRARGVTLVEVMIVVAIVGILAALGFVGWRKLTNSSHVVEATQIVSAVRVAQEKYKSEVGSYANVSVNLAYSQATHHDSLYPHCSMSSFKEPGNFKVGWGATCPASCCNTGAPSWSSLQVTTDGPVMYGYSTIAGNAATNPPAGIPIGNFTMTWPSPLNGPWYVVSAVGDVDGNGKFCTVLGQSFENEIRVDMDGE